jgi:hypothetical protein
MGLAEWWEEAGTAHQEDPSKRCRFKSHIWYGAAKLGATKQSSRSNRCTANLRRPIHLYCTTVHVFGGMAGITNAWSTPAWPSCALKLMVRRLVASWHLHRQGCGREQASGLRDALAPKMTVEASSPLVSATWAAACR